MIKTYSKTIIVLIAMLFVNCKNTSIKNKLLGKWHSEDKKITLQISAKEFTLNEGEEPISESYFVKADTIFTSYEGSAPFTKFIVKDLADKSLTLVYPDSNLVKFLR